MPSAMQFLSLVSPIRYYMDIALGVMLKGMGLGILWPQFLGLAVIAGALIALGLLRLGNRLYACLSNEEYVRLTRRRDNLL